MAESSINKRKLIFKSVYYFITLLAWGLLAWALRRAYHYINLPKAFWIALVCVGVIYFCGAYLFTLKTGGLKRFISHCLLLQLAPLCAFILTLWVTSSHMDVRPIAGVANTYERSFNDLQDTQKRAAVRNGLAPFKSRNEIKSRYKQLRKDKKLVEISTNQKYIVQNLTYSSPYVVPKVEKLLNDLADAFQEKTQSKAKFVVTSVLRTEEDVKKLQKVNGNASSASCHCNGTTIDISYVRFGEDRRKPYSKPELRLALAQALHELRKEGRCYVKIEKKQYCYHITVR